MREIKFRAWFTDGESKVTDGQVCSTQEDRTLLEFLQDIEDCKKDHGYNAILMQYTGLKDKNGVEIYEGDIVKDMFGCLHEIKWCNDFAQFYGEYINDDVVEAELLALQLFKDIEKAPIQRCLLVRIFAVS